MSEKKKRCVIIPNAFLKRGNYIFCKLGIKKWTHGRERMNYIERQKKRSKKDKYMAHIHT